MGKSSYHYTQLIYTLKLLWDKMQKSGFLSPSVNTSLSWVSFFCLKIYIFHIVWPTTSASQLLNLGVKQKEQPSDLQSTLEKRLVMLDFLREGCHSPMWHLPKTSSKVILTMWFSFYVLTLGPVLCVRSDFTMCAMHHARCWKYSGQWDRHSSSKILTKERAAEVEVGRDNLLSLKGLIREKARDIPEKAGWC